MSATLCAIGTARPAFAVGQQRAAELLLPACCRDDGERRTLRALFRRSGVERRGSVLLTGAEGELDPRFGPLPEDAAGRGPGTAARMRIYQSEALPLAASAARRALESAGIAPAEITHLFLVTCTGFHAPGPETALIPALGLSPGVRRAQIGFMGCAGALNALALAGAIVRAEPGARALVCAVELCTLHLQFGWDPQLLVGDALFADGAAAVVLAAQGAHLGAAPWTLAASASRLFPDSESAMSWKVRDHGFELALSAAVPDLIGAQLAPFVTDWLAGCGLTIDSVASWAVHPGGPRILDAVASALALAPGALDVSREILARCGNMSSPTVLFLLEELARRDAPGPCVALGFGPGLVAEAALFERLS